MKTSDNNLTIKPHVFVFCRDYLIDDFQENLTPLNNEFNFHYLTDGKKAGVSDTRKRFYERLDIATRPDILTEEIEEDIISRCRYLGNLQKEQAKKMLYSMASVLIEEIEKNKPSIVLSQLAEEYITHLLSEIAKQKSINYIGYAYSYFSGKAQVTQFSNGSPFNIREPSSQEVADVIRTISQPTFRQDYLQKDTYTILRHSIAVFRYWIKVAAFTLLKISKNDPLNFHYGCLPYVAERRFFSCFPSKKDFHEEWKNLVLVSKNDMRKKIIYFPLAYVPEATTNYWIENKKILNYEETVLEICNYLSTHYTVIVKEHLHMLGARDPIFYQKIKTIKNVISVPPKVFSNEVVSNADIVFLGGGSIGVESFIREKPILTYCNSSYWYSISNALYLNISDIENWKEKIEYYFLNYENPSDAQKEDFIKQCLSSTMSIKKPGKIWPICNTDHLETLLNKGIERNI